jgi:hypothetical protein
VLVCRLLACSVGNHYVSPCGTARSGALNLPPLTGRSFWVRPSHVTPSRRTAAVLSDVNSGLFQFRRAPIGYVSPSQLVFLPPPRPSRAGGGFVKLSAARERETYPFVRGENLVPFRAKTPPFNWSEKRGFLRCAFSDSMSLPPPFPRIRPR